MVISFFTGLSMGLLEFALAPFFAAWFNVSESVRISAIMSLRAKGFSQPFRALTMVSVVGILRSGGDTKYAALAEMSGVYLVGVPVAFLGAKVFAMPLYLIYLALSLEEIAKFLFSFIRIRSKKWAHVLTDKA